MREAGEGGAMRQAEGEVSSAARDDYAEGVAKRQAELRR